MRFPTRIDALYSIFGVRPSAEAPKNFILGPFVFEVTFADNATTEVDLTAAAQCVDPQLRTILNFTADDPELMLNVTGVRLRAVEGAETEVLTAQALSRSELFWSSGGISRSVGLGPYAESWSIESTLANAVAFRDAYKQDSQLPIPILVNLNQDDFVFRPNQAVNTTTPLTMHLIVEGAAFRIGPEYLDYSLNCINNMKGQGADLGASGRDWFGIAGPGRAAAARMAVLRKITGGQKTTGVRGKKGSIGSPRR